MKPLKFKNFMKFTALLMAILVVFVMVNPAKAEAASASNINTFQIQDRLMKLKKNYNNTYFTNVGGVYGKECPNSKSYHRTTSCGYCNVLNVCKTKKIKKEYSKVTSSYLAHHAVTPSSSSFHGDSCFGFASYAGYYVYGNGKNVDVDTRKIGTYTYSAKNYSKLKNVLRPGDIIRFDSAHSVIYYGTLSSKSGMKVIDSNWGSRRCKVTTHYVSYGSYGKVTIYRGTKVQSVKTPSITVTPTSNGNVIQTSAIAGADGYTFYKYSSSKKKYVALKSTTSTKYTDSSAGEGVKTTYIVQAYNKFDGKTYYTSPSKAKSATRPYTKYTVSYYDNGGWGGPDPQIKIKGKALSISEVEPYRDGYTFGGWATCEDGPVVYRPGDVYSDNKSVVLHAVWELKKEGLKDLGYVSAEEYAEHYTDEEKYAVTRAYRYATRELETTTSTTSNLDGWTYVSKEVTGKYTYGKWNGIKPTSGTYESRAANYYYAYTCDCKQYFSYTNTLTHRSCGTKIDNRIGLYTSNRLSKTYGKDSSLNNAYILPKTIDKNIAGVNTLYLLTYNGNRIDQFTSNSTKNRSLIWFSKETYVYRTKTPIYKYNFKRYTDWSEWSEPTEEYRKETDLMKREKLYHVYEK